MIERSPSRESQQDAPSEPDFPDLSKEAQELLVEASEDQGGIVMAIRSMIGLEVQTHNKQFIEQGNPRSEAAWQAALDELETKGLIRDEGYKSEVFLVTKEGYRVADILKTRRTNSQAETTTAIRLIPYPRPNENYLSLKVFNDAGKPLECYGKLDALVQLGNAGSEPNIAPEINPNNYMLSWAGGSEAGYRTIGPGDFEVLNIAEYLDDEIVFIFQKGAPQRRPAGQYKVHIRVRGRAGYEQVEPVSFMGYMEARIVRENGSVFRRLDIREEA